HLKIESQIAGNCSWANVEATLPALFFMLLSELDVRSKKEVFCKTTAINFFHYWREWNKERLLQFLIQSYHEADSLRKACKAEILVAILFQCCYLETHADRERMEMILSLLLNSPYEYLLKNYLHVYYYDSPTPEGKRFSEFL